MDARAEVGTLARPPTHLEGNLLFHRPTKLGIARSKRGFFVLLQTVIHQYESENTYRKGQRSLKEFEIRLEEVCEITEVLIPTKQYKNCSFSLTLNNGSEHLFSAESREAMEEWVIGLRAAKEFWAQHQKREEVKLKMRQNPFHVNDIVSVHNEVAKMDDSISSNSDEDSKLIDQVHVTTWDGVTHKVLLPLIFDVEELLSALSGKMQGTRCTACPICKLQQSSMEVWTVDDRGIGKKLDLEGGTLDVSKHGRHFYLLVHNYKLLIIHFEDGTFQVLPHLISLKAKEVPYLPIFADKLASLGFSNFGLFLVTDAGTSFLFAPEDQPLKHSFHTGRFFLKNKALTVSSPPPSPSKLDIQVKQLKKAQQNRRNRKAFKKAEEEKSKQESNSHVRNLVSNKAFASPIDDLVFYDDHYSAADAQNKPLASTCAEHINTGLASTSGERKCSSTEHNSEEDGRGFAEVSQTPIQRPSISQGDGNGTGLNTDECKVRNEGAGTDLRGKGKDKVTKPDIVATKSLEETERLVQENKNNFGKSNSSAKSQSLPSLSSPNMSNEQTIQESLEPPRPFSIDRRSSEQMEGRIKVEVTHSKDSEQEEEDGEPSLTDPRLKSKIAPEVLTNAALGTRVKTGVTSNDLVNHNNTPLTVGDESSHLQSCKPANEEIPVRNGGKSDNKILSGTISYDGVPLSSSLSSLSSSSFSSSLSSSSSSSSAEGGSPMYAANAAIPIKGTEETTDVPSNLPGLPMFTDQESGDACMPSVCKERPRFEVHHCDYTPVGFPRFLELVLKVCSGHKVNEEEVGEANILKRICLSGWHLCCENGVWSVVEHGRSSISSENLSSTVKVQLSERLEALFHREEKVWTVIENPNVADESSVVEPPVQNQILNGMLDELEDISADGDAVSNAEPDVSQAPAIKPQDDVNENAKNLTLATSELSRAPASACVLNSNSEHSLQGVLHTAIQGIFHYMSKLRESPEEALDDSKHDGVVQSVCEPLCVALWNVLSVGLRKKRFIGKHTVWDVVENFKDVLSHVHRTVDWVNKKYACLGEPQKFQAFVCECLNIGHGTLHRWLESLLNQKGRLAKYYDQDGIMFKLPRGKLEEIVIDLSRISSLPFVLHSESWIKMQGYDLNGPAFAFE